MFTHYLSEKYECGEAGSFEEAVAELRKAEYGVVISDIIMPGMSGIELLRKVNEDYPSTSVIMVSGVDRPQRVLDALRLGAFDYLIKPCDADVILITVERALERRSLLINESRYKVELERRNEELNRRKDQLERLQAQVVQSEKMASLGQLAAGVAHEVNNPVGFVAANLEMLGQYVDDLVMLVKAYDDEIEDPAEMPRIDRIKREISYPSITDDVVSIIRDCKEGADRIRDIVQNLRTFSRLDEAEYKETDINEGIDATIRLLSRYFSSGKIMLIRDYGDIPTVWAFSSQLNQVWMNLLVNAAQAIGNDNGEVRITTTADEFSVYVKVSDSGSGIAVQHLNRIFDPFYTTKAVGEGTGLGLSISFSIIERRGGSIAIDTELGTGTTFTVILPRQFEPEVEQKAIDCYTDH